MSQRGNQVCKPRRGNLSFFIPWPPVLSGGQTVPLEMAKGRILPAPAEEALSFKQLLNIS